MEVVGALVVVVAIFLIIVLLASIKILREYERGVIFRLGRLIDTKGPGLILLIPFIDRIVKIDLRTVTLNIPPQEVITRDNVPTSVNAVCYFRVLDPNRANSQRGTHRRNRRPPTAARRTGINPRRSTPVRLCQ